MAPSFLANQCWINEVQLQTGPLSSLKPTCFWFFLWKPLSSSCLQGSQEALDWLSLSTHSSRSHQVFLGWWIEFTWRINLGIPCRKAPNVNTCLKVSRAGVHRRATVPRNIFLNERGCRMACSAVCYYVPSLHQVLLFECLRLLVPASLLWRSLLFCQAVSPHMEGFSAQESHPFRTLRCDLSIDQFQTPPSLKQGSYPHIQTRYPDVALGPKSS